MERFIEQLGTLGYASQPGFLTREEISLVVGDLDRVYREGQFRRAGVGKGGERQTHDEIRRDNIYWLPTLRSLANSANLDGTGAGDLPLAQQTLFRKIEELRQAFNHELFLGLWEFEGHYALYPPGGFYRRHRDVFRDDDARTVSMILYLNEEWAPGDGGELRMYPRMALESAPASSIGVEAPFVEIQPTAGTLACFLSREIEHEVLESFVQRRSFTGWFKCRR